MSKNVICPDDNILAAFAEGKLNSAEYEDVFVHIATCRECREACSFMAGSLVSALPPVSERRKKSIRQKLIAAGAPLRVEAGNPAWKDFVLRIEQLSSFYEQDEVLAASCDMGAVIFSSVSGCDRQYRWKMRLNIPVRQSKTLPIDLAVAQDSYPNGKLLFCGNELQVVKGKASISLEALQKSIHNPEVIFCFADGTQIAGRPEL